MRRWFGLVASVAVVSLGAGPALAGGGVHAGGGGGGGNACPGFASGETIQMLDSCFAGVTHFAAAGATLRITNDGQMPHTFTAADGTFDSGFVEPGDSIRVELQGEGVLRYYCTLHGNAQGAGMAGTLVAGDFAQPVATLLGVPTSSDAAPSGAADLDLAASPSAVDDGSANDWIGYALAVIVALGTLLGAGALVARSLGRAGR